MHPFIRSIATAQTLRQKGKVDKWVHARERERERERESERERERETKAKRNLVVYVWHSCLP